MLVHWSDPPNNIWWLSRSPPPPSLHFPSKFEWFPLWILPKLSVIPPFGFSVITDSSFCSPKYQVSPAQAINNGGSLTTLLSHFTDQNECLNVAFWQTINHSCVLIKDWTLYYYYKKMYIIISNASSFNALSVIYKISLSLKKKMHI